MNTESKPRCSASTANSRSWLGLNCSAEALYPSRSIGRAFGRQPVVERGALTCGTADARRQRLKFGGVQLLPVHPARRPGDRFVHERSTQVVGTRIQTDGCPF